MRKTLAFLFLLFTTSLLHGQVCSSGALPATINSGWTLRACSAISAGGGESSCGGTTCRSKVLGFFFDRAVNVHDTASGLCDDDYDFTSGTSVVSFDVVDNALGSGTVNSSNSGGNSLIVRATGSNFAAGWVGGTVMINGVSYVVTVFTDTSHITVSGNTGTISGQPYVAGNQWTELAAPGKTGPQTEFNFSNVGNHVQGNEFYLLDSAYATASGYQVTCQSLVTGGNGVSDMDMSVRLFRQPGGLGSSGLDASTDWSVGTTAGSGCNQGPAGLGCPEGTVSVTRSVTNDLVLSSQQQNGQTEGTNLSSPVGCDNDGTTASFSGFYYYGDCSSSSASGSISVIAYSGASSNYANTVYALLPTVGVQPPTNVKAVVH